MVGKVPGRVSPDEDSGFKPFIADTFVSLVGTVTPISIKLLLDKDANHSLISQCQCFPFI